MITISKLVHNLSTTRVFFSNLHFLSPALSLDNPHDVEAEF